MSNGIKQRIVYVLTRTNKADDDDTDLYVGSTSIPLSQTMHMCNHRCIAIKKGYKNNRLYKRMREVGLKNWEAFPLLSRTCDVRTIRELVRKWVGVLQADLNSRNVQKDVQQQHAEYYKNNKTAIRKYQSDYREKLKEEKRFYCDVCNLACISNGDLKKHLSTLKHLNALDTYSSAKNRAEYYKANQEKYRKNIEGKRYYCDVCEMSFGNNGNLKKHIGTLKHLRVWLNAVD